MAVDDNAAGSLLDRIVGNTGDLPSVVSQVSVDSIDWSKLLNGRAIKQVQQLYRGQGRSKRHGID